MRTGTERIPGGSTRWRFPVPGKHPDDELAPCDTVRRKWQGTCCPSGETTMSTKAKRLAETRYAPMNIIKPDVYKKEASVGQSFHDRRSGTTMPRSAGTTPYLSGAIISRGTALPKDLYHPTRECHPFVSTSPYRSCRTISHERLRSSYIRQKQLDACLQAGAMRAGATSAHIRSVSACRNILCKEVQSFLAKQSRNADAWTHHSTGTGQDRPCARVNWTGAQGLS